MTKSTKKFMRSVRRRLEKCIQMHFAACGHEEPLYAAFRYEDKMLAFIQAEVERLEEEVERWSGSPSPPRARWW